MRFIEALFRFTAASLLIMAVPASGQLSMGNGDANWIVTDGATRDGATLTFSKVKIEGNGWLVLHPFENGKPNGRIYVGHTFVEDGLSENVAVELDAAPNSGDMFIVMLHRDANDNREFDFVFVDEKRVVDEAVFERSKMIGHAWAAP